MITSNGSHMHAMDENSRLLIPCHVLDHCPSLCDCAEGECVASDTDKFTDEAKGHLQARTLFDPEHTARTYLLAEFIRTVEVANHDDKNGRLGMTAYRSGYLAELTTLITEAA